MYVILRCYVVYHCKGKFGMRSIHSIYSLNRLTYTCVQFCLSHSVPICPPNLNHPTSILPLENQFQKLYTYSRYTAPAALHQTSKNIHLFPSL